MILTEYFLAISIAKLVLPEAVGPIKKITSLFESIAIGIVGIYVASLHYNDLLCDVLSSNV
jgi:hypothetical protein